MKNTFLISLVLFSLSSLGQTLYVPSGTSGIGTSTVAGNVGIGTTTPQSSLEVRKSNVVIGQTVNIAHFIFDGQNHFDQPGTYTDGRLVLGTKAYSNGIIKRAEIGFSNSDTWRGGILKFYTSPDDDTGIPLARMTINQNGSVGIGTTTPGSFKLAVEGKIGAREVNVTLANPWPDYVFAPTYNLPTLESIKTYIDQNKHLPEVPSAKEMEANGINLGDMNMLLLKKIEELTLYILEQNKKLEKLEERSVSPDLSGKKIEELTLWAIELKKENESQSKEMEELWNENENLKQVVIEFSDLKSQIQSIKKKLN